MPVAVAGQQIMRLMLAVLVGRAVVGLEVCAQAMERLELQIQVVAAAQAVRLVQLAEQAAAV
jgi:hypothetical protein